MVPLEVGERLWTGELEEAIGGSAGKLSVRPVPMIPVGEDFMKGLMAAVGDRGRLLSTVGGADEMELGRKMVTSVLEGLLEEKNLQWAAVASLEEGGEVVKAAMQAAGMKLGSGGLGSGAGGVEKLRRLADVVRDLLEFLSREGVVMRGGRAGWSLRVEHTLSLRAAHWFFSRGPVLHGEVQEGQTGPGHGGGLRHPERWGDGGGNGLGEEEEQRVHGEHDRQRGERQVQARPFVRGG